MKILPFATIPSFHSRPWGGRAMADVLGKDIPEGPLGESWEVSAHPNGVSRVSGGPYDMMPLDELTRAAGAALLGARVHAKYGGSFPLLVKLIDVNALASIQVHPNDEQALRLEGYPWGKTEAWFILSRKPDASFCLGMVPGVTAESFRAALAEGSARSLLATPRVEAGDCLLVPPGTVHAAGNGALLLEVQQSSDITYRVYDWDRVDEKGKKRELHVDKALQVIDFSARPQIFRAAAEKDALNRVLACAHFEMFEARVASRVALPPREACSTGTVVEGSCRLVSEDTAIALACGQSFVIPAGTGARLEGAGARVVLTVIA
jgi:mannose-6-phosphate isomerase